MPIKSVLYLLGTLLGIFFIVLVSVHHQAQKQQAPVQVVVYNAPSVQLPENLSQPLSPKEAPLNKSKVNASLETTYDLPSGILSLVHAQETSGRCKVVSSAQAKGCFQFRDIAIKDVTQRFNYKFDPFNYKESAKAAAMNLAYLYSRVSVFTNASIEARWSLVLAAYNAGLTTVTNSKWDVYADTAQFYPQVTKHINYPETRNYVNSIASKLFGTKHLVQQGDSLYKISNKYNKPIKELIELVGTTTIYPDQIIKVN